MLRLTRVGTGSPAVLFARTVTAAVAVALVMAVTPMSGSAQGEDARPREMGRAEAFYQDVGRAHSDATTQLEEVARAVYAGGGSSIPMAAPNTGAGAASPSAATPDGEASEVQTRAPLAYTYHELLTLLQADPSRSARPDDGSGAEAPLSVNPFALRMPRPTTPQTFLRNAARGTPMRVYDDALLLTDLTSHWTAKGAVTSGLSDAHSAAANEFGRLVRSLDAAEASLADTIARLERAHPPSESGALDPSVLNAHAWRNDVQALRARAYARWGTSGDILNVYTRYRAGLPISGAPVPGDDGGDGDEIPVRRIRRNMRPSDSSVAAIRQQVAKLFTSQRARGTSASIEFLFTDEEQSDPSAKFTTPFDGWTLTAVAGMDPPTGTTPDTYLPAHETARQLEDLEAPSPSGEGIEVNDRDIPDMERSYLLATGAEAGSSASVNSHIVRELRTLCLETARALRFRLAGDITQPREETIEGVARDFYRWYFEQVLLNTSTQEQLRRAVVLMRLDQLRFHQDAGLSTSVLSTELETLRAQVGQLDSKLGNYLEFEKGALTRQRIREDSAGNERHFIQLDMDNALSQSAVDAGGAFARALVVPQRVPVSRVGGTLSVRYKFQDQDAIPMIRLAAARTIYALGSTAVGDTAEAVGVGRAYWDVSIADSGGLPVSNAAVAVYISNATFESEKSVPMALTAFGSDQPWNNNDLLHPQSWTCVAARPTSASVRRTRAAQAASGTPSSIVETGFSASSGDWDSGSRMFTNTVFTTGPNELVYYTRVGISANEGIRLTRPPVGIDIVTEGIRFGLLLTAAALSIGLY